MHRLLGYRDHHGRRAHLPITPRQGRQWFDDAFPELVDQRYFAIDKDGNMGRESVAGGTQVGQTTLNRTGRDADALIASLYTRFYGDLFTRLPASRQREAVSDAASNAQLMFCKCIPWHEDQGYDAHDHRLLYVLCAEPSAWRLQLASAQATQGWRQRGRPHEPEDIRCHVEHDLVRGDIIGFDQGCLHRVMAQRLVTAQQRPLLVMNLTAISFE